MDEGKARKTLGNSIKEDNSLQDPYNYLDWEPGTKYATLDSIYEAEELEAIAWWMENKKVKKGEN